MASRNTETVGTVGGAWLSAILKLGVPAAIAIFMTYFMATAVMAGMADHQTLLIKHDTNAADLKQRIEQHFAGDEKREAEMLFLFRQICVNTAKNEPQKIACLGQ